VTRRRTLASWSRPIALGLAGVGMLAVLAVGTNWRLALIAALAGGAIALTRLRYAGIAAVGFLAITLLVAQTGHSAGSDHRDVVREAPDR
jgi:uncharacterized membrane protein YuzA (DUF378 family)